MSSRAPAVLLAVAAALAVTAPASASHHECADIVHYRGWGADEVESSGLSCHDAHTVAKHAILAAPELDDTPAAVKRTTLDVPGMGHLRCDVHGVNQFRHDCHGTVNHIRVRVQFVLRRGGTQSTFGGPEL